MVKVIANQECYIDLVLRKRGDVFDYEGQITKDGPIEALDEDEVEALDPEEEEGGDDEDPPEHTREGFMRRHFRKQGANRVEKAPKTRRKTRRKTRVPAHEVGEESPE